MTGKIYNNSIWIIFLLAGLLFVAFENKQGPEVPLSKVEKEARRVLKFSSVSIHPLSDNVLKAEQTVWYSLIHEGKKTGFVAVSRVKSCRAGGCDAGFGLDQQPFEYFDYFVIFSSEGEVLKVNVFNYQATRGHEIMSHGWLRQFKGANANKTLVVGREIQAISGATISVNAITADVVLKTSCLSKYLADSLVLQ